MPLQKIFDKLSVSEISFRDITCESTCCTCPQPSFEDALPRAKKRSWKTRKKSVRDMPPPPAPRALDKIATGVPAERPEAATAPTRPHATEREVGWKLGSLKAELRLTKSNSF